MHKLKELEQYKNILKDYKKNNMKRDQFESVFSSILSLHLLCESMGYSVNMSDMEDLEKESAEYFDGLETKKEGKRK